MERKRLYFISFILISEYISIYFFAYYFSLFILATLNIFMIFFSIGAFIVSYMGFSTITPIVKGLFKSIFLKDDKELEEYIISRDTIINHKRVDYENDPLIRIISGSLIFFIIFSTFSILFYYYIENSQTLSQYSNFHYYNKIPFESAKKMLNIWFFIAFILGFIISIPFVKKSILDKIPFSKTNL